MDRVCCPESVEGPERGIGGRAGWEMSILTVWWKKLSEPAGFGPDTLQSPPGQRERDGGDGWMGSAAILLALEGIHDKQVPTIGM